MRRLLPLVSCLMLAAGASAQIVHRGATAYEKVTETTDYVDTWALGGQVLAGTARDVLVRIERVGTTSTSTEAHLLLFGPWGTHLYTFDERSQTTEGAVVTGHLTTWSAIDVDGDGDKELVFIERTARARTALDAQGRVADDSGPFFEDFSVSARWLSRKDGTLVQNDVDGNPDSPVFTALLARELGGSVSASLQLLAADWLFKQQQFEKAKYRYQIVREWAEKSLPGRYVAALSPDMALASVDPDEPALAWIQATRRIGSLPGWYQRH
jgi:hypothetical protein